MQGLAGKSVAQIRRGLAKQFWRQTAFAAIGLIAQQSMACIRHMHPDLMRAPGFQPAFDQRRTGCEIFDHAGAGDGVAACVPQNRLALAVGFVARKARGDFQDATGFKADTTQAAQARVIAGWNPVHYGQIMAVDGVGFKLRGQPVMRTVGFGHHQQPGGIFINAVNNAGATLAADAGQRIAAMGQQRIDQRARRRAGGRMHHHARGFVDHDQIAVFPDHRQRDIFGQSIDRHGRFQPYGVNLALSDFGFGVCN